MKESFSALSESFARCLGEIDPNNDCVLRRTLKLVCRAVAQGHVCLKLDAYAEKSADDGDGQALPPLAEWLRRLHQSPLVGRPGDFTPLILDTHNRLYLARYWQYEKNLADRLITRLAQPVEGIDEPRLKAVLNTLFQENPGQPDWQKAAAATAVLKRVCVISGGPGTGKTSTVIRILATLQAMADDKPLRIALAAPTGKAAARMQDTIRAAKQSLPLEARVLDSIPERASTLHRLLGNRPNSVYFRHARDNPLPVDVLVVDEASMIDLASMAKLVDALPDRARLILLGDKAQLASVEAGDVFGDICAFRGYSEGFRARLVAVAGVDPGPAINTSSPLGDATVSLMYSRRFAGDSGIGELARCIDAGQVQQAVDVLESERFGDIDWRNASVRSLRIDLADRLQTAYGAYFEALRENADPNRTFGLFNTFRVLTAHREGDCSAAAVNTLMEDRLRARRRSGYRAEWYPGRPIMIAHNDYNLNLFNGDVGITLIHDGKLRVFFETGDGEMTSFAPERLPPHETVYAMTVHKSQGSEFNEVLLLLPDVKTEVLNRALLYTAVTRARTRAEIWGRQAVLEQAVAALPVRYSGLRDRLVLHAG